MTLADDFRAARLPAALVHLDTAACGRASTAVLDAVAAHARHEVEVGGYVAQAAAAPALDALRTGLGALMGFEADDVAFVESAGVALTTVMRAWNLAPGARVAVLPSEYGPNLGVFEDLGLETVALPGAEHLDLDALEASLKQTRPDLVHLTQVGSHRGTVQPVAAAAEIAEGLGIPLVVDQAQAVGHVDTVTTAAAAYGTSRKWLCGPRGVGFLAVRSQYAPALVEHAPALPARWWPPIGTRMLAFESPEAHVAGRVGLAVAVTEHLAHGPAAVHAALAEVGRRTRTALGELPGWRVVEGDEDPSSTTTVVPPDGVDVAALRAALLERGFVTTVSGLNRAPKIMTEVALRVSPHVDVTDVELAAFCTEIVGAAR